MVTAVSINEWLFEVGLLEAVTLFENKKQKLPTSRGREMGIFAEERIGEKGNQYYVVHFSTEAQQFIYDNVTSIVASQKTRKLEKYD